MIVLNWTGALEVQVANMAKKDRCSTEEVYVVGFVPSHQLPRKRPCAIDPFLYTLVVDLTDLFLDGKVHGIDCITNEEF